MQITSFVILPWGHLFPEWFVIFTHELLCGGYCFWFLKLFIYLSAQCLSCSTQGF